MNQYHDLLERILADGAQKHDRTGTGTLSIFGHQMRFNLQSGFPLLTTKRLPLKAIVHELLWFLKGDTNIKYLKDNGVSIWDEWADENGELGPVYGYQWRHWRTPDGREIDQIRQVQEEIRANPHSRRLIVTAWNPADVAAMALPPLKLRTHASLKRFVPRSHGRSPIHARQSQPTRFSTASTHCSTRLSADAAHALLAGGESRSGRNLVVHCRT